MFDEFGEIDPSGSDVTRLCFLAYDDRAIHTPNATAISWEAPEHPERDAIGTATAQFTGKADLEALDYIHSDDYDIWYQVGLALYRAGAPIDTWIQWSEKSEKSSGNTAEMYQQKWKSFANPREKAITWASVIHLARQNGYNPRRNHKPVKLCRRTDIECVTEPVEKARDALRQSFEDDERLIGFRADTGIGKTHETITLYQIKGIEGFFSTPTTELAKEVEARLDTAECDVFRWRGLHAEPNGAFPHEKPCMFPDEYRAYAESGRNAYKMLCEPVCPHLDECEQHGYRSQETKAKAAQVTVAAHKDLLMNPLFRSTADRLLPKHDRDLIVIDEFDVFEAFIKIEVSQARLEYLRDTWRDHPLGDFAMDLLHACVVQNAPYTGIAAIKEYLKDHPTKQKAIIDGLSSYRRGNTIFSRKEAQGIGSDIGQTLEHIRSLPKIEREGWNLLIQLEIFFDRYHHADGAPMEWKDGTLTFYLPPLPDYTKYTKAKVLCMSATLNKVFFEKAFAVRQAKRKDVGFIDAADTEWDPKAKVFQLRTNRNPRHTLLTREKNDKEQWHYTGLTDTGQQALDAILQSAKANPERQHALISYKFVIETYAEQIADAGITTGHFGGLVGLDSHFNRDTDDGIVLHLLGAPHEPPEITEHHYNLLYGDLEKPPDFTRDDTTGEYLDSNMQAVYEAGVKSELMQAIGRAGLVKNPSTVVLRTSLELPSVSHREQTLHFDETDWMNADGNLDALPATIEAREAQEAAEAEAIEAGDVKAVMEATGKSRGTAYRQTKPTRDQQKAKRDEQVIALHQQGNSLRKIHTLVGEKLNISYGTITNIVKAYKQSQTQEVTYLEHETSCTPNENTDVTDTESEPLHTTEPTTEPAPTDTPATDAPIPITEYAKLSLEVARAELQRCEARHNYAGAKVLRDRIKHLEKQGMSPSTQPDAPTCDTSVATGELEALGFESETLQLQHATTGEVISVTVLSRPQPRGITQDWMHARKEAITNDITALYHDGEPPSEIASFLGIPEPFVNAVIASLDF